MRPRRTDRPGAARSDDVDRQVFGLQRRGDRAESRPRAAQDSEGGQRSGPFPVAVLPLPRLHGERLRAPRAVRKLLAHSQDPGHELLQLRGLVRTVRVRQRTVRERDLDCSVTRTRPGLQTHPLVTRRESGGDPVRRGEDGRVVAPRDREAVLLGGAVVRTAERARERLDVVRAGTAPPVDRLPGIPDGHDRVSTEDLLEHEELRIGRVLELVQQDDVPARLLRGEGCGLSVMIRWASATWSENSRPPVSCLAAAYLRASSTSRFFACSFGDRIVVVGFEDGTHPRADSA